MAARRGGIQAVTRQGLAGTFTDLVNPTLLNALGAGQPSAAIDGAGNAIVAYQVTTVPPSIGALRHTAGGSWAVAGDSITPSGGHAVTRTRASQRIRPVKWSSRSLTRSVTSAAARSAAPWPPAGASTRPSERCRRRPSPTDHSPRSATAATRSSGGRPRARSSSPTSAPTGAFPAPGDRSVDRHRHSGQLRACRQRTR